MKKTLILLLLLVAIAPALTRWETTRFTPTADFVGAGRFVANYNIFLNTENGSGSGISGTSLGGLTVGASEWFQGTLGYADGLNFAIKGRILNEYNRKGPSLAIGVQNMFHNETLARSGLNANNRSTTGELFAAFGKSSEFVRTRFHAGVLSLPDSKNDKINGFVGIEKYFGDDFYLTLEGFSQQRNFYLALTATVRFLPNNIAELYFSLLDLERMFVTKNRDFGVTLTPNSHQDWIKPGIVAGFSLNLGGRKRWVDGRAQFRTVEDNFAHHDSLIRQMALRFEAVERDIECLNVENAHLKTQIDSLKLALNAIKEHDVFDTLPANYSEIYALVVSFAQNFTNDRFNPHELRRILNEIRSFGNSIDVLGRIAEREQNRVIKLRAITILGELRAREKVGLLLRILDETNESRIKVEIITALGRISDRSVAPKIREFATSSDSNLRIAASEVLERWNNSAENIPPTVNNDVFLVEPLE